jgi:hypothetical protein
MYLALAKAASPGNEQKRLRRREPNSRGRTTGKEQIAPLEKEQRPHRRGRA